MQENIRKIVETAGCPILAVPLSLRQGWETTMASPVLVFAFGSSSALYPCQNVAKSVAKARKNTHVTASQHQPHQQHRRRLTQETPHPPLFRPNRAYCTPLSSTWIVARSSSLSAEKSPASPERPSSSPSRSAPPSTPGFSPQPSPKPIGTTPEAFRTKVLFELMQSLLTATAGSATLFADTGFGHLRHPALQTGR